MLIEKPLLVLKNWKTNLASAKMLAFRTEIKEPGIRVCETGALDLCNVDQAAYHAFRQQSGHPSHGMLGFKDKLHQRYL